MRSKISVIVPVYKVEPYLRRCLDSIVGQTYPNLEIILVDDGSPDSCGAICDAYAAKDDRVIVIHQENAGVSAARNAGLDMASGAYFGFVDPDDWIEPDMYASLKEALDKNDADISVCGFVREWDGGTRGYEQYDRVVSGREVVAMLVKDHSVVDVIWNKLYRAAIWKDLRFPVGIRYEDAAVYCPLMDRAEKVAFCSGLQYHYNVCDSGFMQTVGFSEMLMRVFVLQERRLFLKDRYPEMTAWYCADLAGALIALWPAAWENRKNLRTQDRARLVQAAQLAGECYSDTVALRTLGRLGRLKLRLGRYPRQWAFLLSWLLRQIWRWKQQMEGHL